MVHQLQLNRGAVRDRGVPVPALSGVDWGRVAARIGWMAVGAYWAVVMGLAGLAYFGSKLENGALDPSYAVVIIVPATAVYFLLFFGAREVTLWFGQGRGQPRDNHPTDPATTLRIGSLALGLVPADRGILRALRARRALSAQTAAGYYPPSKTERQRLKVLKRAGILGEPSQGRYFIDESRLGSLGDAQRRAALFFAAALASASALTLAGALAGWIT